MRGARQDELRRLVDQVSSGDLAARQALLERYLPNLVEYIRRHAHGHVAAHESASDLAQSVCCEVLGKLAADKFHGRDEAHFRAFLFQAALRKIQDRGRHWARERRDAARERALSSSDALVEGVLRAIRTPSEHAVIREDCEQVVAAIARLDPMQRQVLRMVYEDGLQHREVGERLGIQESHSRTLLARALARLARLLTPG